MKECEIKIVRPDLYGSPCTKFFASNFLLPEQCSLLVKAKSHMSVYNRLIGTSKTREVIFQFLARNNVQSFDGFFWKFLCNEHLSKSVFSFETNKFHCIDSVGFSNSNLYNWGLIPLAEQFLQNHSQLFPSLANRPASPAILLALRLVQNKDRQKGILIHEQIKQKLS